MHKMIQKQTMKKFKQKTLQRHQKLIMMLKLMKHQQFMELLTKKHYLMTLKNKPKKN